jgi:hypothetical protein
MRRKIPEYIPQYFDSPVSLERVEYKASSGSYKATEYLRSLLEFTAIAVLGGDPFNDLVASDMEDKLRRKYTEWCQLPLKDCDPIAMAINWAWPSIEGNIIVFDYGELMNAVEALCMMLNSVEPETIIHRLSENYRQKEAGDLEFFELGETMKYLGVSRESVENVVNANSSMSNPEILRGYDNT